MNYFLLVVILNVFFLIHCQLKFDQLEKKPVSIEINFNDLKLNNSKKKNLNMLNVINNLQHINAPQAIFVKNAIYFRNNYLNKFILRVLIKEKNGLILSNKKTNISILFKFQKLIKNKNVNLIKYDQDSFLITHKSFNFNSILNLAPTWNYGFYVLNNMSLANSFQKKNRKNKFNKNIQPKRYISRFDNNGRFLYKIGINGKISSKMNNELQFFNPNYIPYRIFSDQNGYLYFVLKGFVNGLEQYKLYRYNDKSDLDIYIENISNWIQLKDKNKYQIEQIFITPRSQKLLILLAYYSKSKKNSVKLKYKKLILIDMILKSRKKYKIIKIFNNEIKYSSIFGITSKDNIFYTFNKKNLQTSYIKNNYYFNILNDLGEEIGKRFIILDKKSPTQWQWLKLTSNGKVIIFTHLGSKIVCNFYE